MSCNKKDINTAHYAVWIIGCRNGTGIYYGKGYYEEVIRLETAVVHYNAYASHQVGLVALKNKAV